MNTVLHSVLNPKTRKTLQLNSHSSVTWPKTARSNIAGTPARPTAWALAAGDWRDENEKYTKFDKIFRYLRHYNVLLQNYITTFF